MTRSPRRDGAGPRADPAASHLVRTLKPLITFSSCVLIVACLYWGQAILIPMHTLVEVAAGAAAAEGQALAAGGPPAPNRPGSTATRVDPAQATRLQHVMIPLIKVMDHPMPLNQVKVGIVDDPQINAANAGGDQFFVTIGLLQKANDDQLRAVLAHELAHQDLNHVTKAQVLGTGVNIGAAILHQVFPGSGAIGPLAGALVTRKYSRNEEYAADRHGVELLRRAGYPKDMMIKTLTWLLQTSGPDSGGILSTHPGTAARIEALRKTS